MGEEEGEEEVKGGREIEVVIEGWDKWMCMWEMKYWNGEYEMRKG